MSQQDPSLLALQDELQGLKSMYGDKVRLVKSKGEGAPFPLTVKADFPAPPSMSNYDISGIQVCLRLAREAGLRVDVNSPELPQILREDAAQKLQSQWTRTEEGGWNLGAILRYAEDHLQELITGRPELVEAYESVDANGASVRRYMLIDPKSHVEAASPALGNLGANSIRNGMESSESKQATVDSSLSGHEQTRHALIDASEAIAWEVAYLQRRFRSAFVMASSSASSDEQLGFDLHLTPTDPSWPKDRQLQLRGTITARFPELDSVHLSIASSSDLVPDICALLNKILAAELKAVITRANEQRESKRRRPILGDLARQLENSAGEYLQLAEDVAAQQRRTSKDVHAEVQQQGVDSIQLENLGVGNEEDESSSAESQTDAEWSAEDSLSEEERAVANRGSAERGLEGSTLVLLLQDLKLDNIDAVDPLMLNVQVLCERCQTAWDCQLATDAVSADGLASSGSCLKCSLEWSLELRPLLAHAYSSAVAHLKPHNCRPMDLAPSLFACQCSSCSSIGTFKEVQIGSVRSRTCSSCHLAMSLSYQAVSFIPRAQERRQRQQQSLVGQQLSGTQSKAKQTQDGQLIPGTALPAKGTCKHYPHSYRWLRFPCCGKRFPCDLCHEENSDGHHMKWAARHVCGYCSTEQKIDDRCCNCNKPLAFNSRGAIGSQTRHWEGGQGCRDKRRLDRRDKAKYRGSKAKSVSKKAFRVGEEGAKKRNASKS